MDTTSPRAHDPGQQRTGAARSGTDLQHPHTGSGLQQTQHAGEGGGGSDLRDVHTVVGVQAS